MTPRIRVAGTPYERGQQYRMQARAQVHLPVQAYQRVFAHYAGWDSPAVQPRGGRVEAPIAAFRPAYLDEMRGLAQGAGLDVADVLAINVRREVMYAAKARQAPLAHRTPAECSAFALRPGPARAPRGGCASRPNWDWLLHPAPDAGRPRGPAGRRPQLRHRGRGGPAGQGRPERRGPGPGYQRPGHRRGHRGARAPVPRAAAGHTRLRRRSPEPSVLQANVLPRQPES